MELPDPDDVNKHIDGATTGHRENWWRSLSDEKQIAWTVLLAAGAMGPLGMSVLAAFGSLYAGKVPSANQIEAVILLAVLTAPVFLGLATLVATAHYGAGALMAAGIAAAAGGYVTSSLGPATSLGEFYCYRSFDTLEQACRAFDQAGFQLAASASGGGPSGGARVLGFAFAYTSDARGAIMTMCGAAAGLAFGYLVRVQPQQS